MSNLQFMELAKCDDSPVTERLEPYHAYVYRPRGRGHSRAVISRSIIVVSGHYDSTDQA